MNRRRFLANTSRAAAALGLLPPIAACRPRAPGGPTDDPFLAVRDRHFLKTLELNPVTSTYLGGDGYAEALADSNGRLRDYSVAGLSAEVEFYRGVRNDLARLDPAALSSPARIDREVVMAQAGYLVHQLADRRYQERSIDTYVAEPFRGVDWQIQQMTAVTGDQLGLEREWDLVTARLEGVPQYLDTARGNLAAGRRSGNMPDHRMVARDGVAGSRANAEYFSRTLPALARGYLGNRPFATRVLGRLTAAAERAATAYGEFAAALEVEFPTEGQPDRFAAGEGEYGWRVHNCLRDDRTPQQLFDYGAEQVALYHEQVVAAAAAVAAEARLRLPFGSAAEQRRSVRAVLDHLSRTAPRNDDQLFAWYREAGDRAVRYGREQDLFDIPPDYRLEVTPTPPVLRSTIDAAYYPAPPFKRTGAGRFYLSPTGNDPGALRLNNRASVATTAVHEGFPGHDWHYRFMTAHADQISNVRWLTPGAVEDSFSMWQDSIAIEGWALYAEELMAQPTSDRPHGFYTAGEYLYMLQAQLLRAVRVRVDVGIHTGRMSFDEAVDYFAEQVSFFPGACAAGAADPVARAVCQQASRAIYRYSKWPTQAICYNLGKNAIIDLRDQVARTKGAGFSAKAFHERFLRTGTIPTGFLRQAFLQG